MTDKPIISIIVPCYNQAQYLPETLESVLKQKLENWECVIVNDGSPDNTEDVALEWCKKDTRFKYFRKENGGLSDARNYGIKHSNGKYILPLDSDDLISEDYTTEAIDVFEQDYNNEIRVVFCRAMLFGVDTGEWDLLPYSYRNMLFIRNCIYCSGVYRRVDYDKTVGYNTNMTKGWEDYDFWLSLLSPEDKVVKLDKFHFFYRTKNVSMRTAITENLESELRLLIFKNHMDIYLKYLNPIEMNRKLMKLEHIETSIQYKIGGLILAPFRYLRNLFRKKGQ